MEENKIIYGDCFDLIKDIPDNYIDLIVTSPPYADIKSYGKNVNVLHPDRYNDWLMPLMVELYRVLKPTGSFIINIGDKVVKKIRHIYVFEFPVRVTRETNLLLYDRYFWSRNGIPNGNRKRLNNFIEFIFHFVKDVDRVKFNIDSVREKYKDSSFRRMKSSMNFYKIDENGVKVLDHQKKKKLNPNGKRPDGLFEFSTNSKMRGNKHPAPFHTDLPEWFIKALTDEGDIVLDPFIGSGSTARAAIKTNRRWIGFENNKAYIDMAYQYINDDFPGFENNNLDFFV
jgi:site-specific DNA-methyltransferase (adenine-specific)